MTISFLYKSNTMEIFSAEKTIESIVSLNLFKNNISIVIPHIMELISNVYTHASKPNTVDIVNWELKITKNNNLITICVSDDGRGVQKSLSDKGEKYTFDEKNSIEFAVEGRINNRGLGLWSIFNDVKRGELFSFELNSDSICYHLDQEKKDVTKISKYLPGVRATIAISAETTS